MKLLKKLIIGLIIFPISLLAQEWKPLFNGKDLKNWEKKNGTATYKIVDNTIIGISKINTPNTFLCTKEIYSDFILEIETNIEIGLNSGIQIRSNSSPDYFDGRVHGYQIEIDPSSRKWSGGIYEEGRRGWLYPLSINKKGGEAFKNGTWNKYRIEAVGNTIKTWINGVQCSNLIDAVDAKGFIALQVHGIGNNKVHEGLTVQWKNLRILTKDIKKYTWKDDPQVPEINLIPNELSEREKREGWRLLWDGKTTNGWRGAKLNEFPKKGWEINEGVLSVLKSDGGESTNGGDIVTTEMFSNFELQLDFKITKGANSGIKYFVDTELNKGVGSAIGCEFQILDDKNHPDAKKGVKNNRTLGSLYDLIAAENLSEKDNKNKRVHGVGSWNRAKIVVKENIVEHWLNDIKVVEYNRHSQIFQALVNYSKYAKYEKFGQKVEGRILLQDHGNKVSFRSIKIKELGL